EHFSPVFNAVLPSAVVFTHPGAIAVGHQSSNASNHYGWSNDRGTGVSPGASLRVQQARNARLVIA
ncbi:hypothetical protein, partial [Pseudomonas syringae]|uniref:hypothetical protein n=1 Tax=Pseudomonas syringae TaxID=317 RepID=UPI00195A3693